MHLRCRKNLYQANFDGRSISRVVSQMQQPLVQKHICRPLHIDIQGISGGEAIEVSPELVVEAGPVGLLEAGLLEPPQNLAVHLLLLPLPPVPRRGGGRLVHPASAALVVLHRHHGTPRKNSQHPHTRTPKPKKDALRMRETDGEAVLPPHHSPFWLLPDTT